MVSYNKDISVSEIPYFQQSEVSEDAKINFFDYLAEELILNIFSYLSTNELAKYQRVNSKWKVLMSDETLWKALPPIIAFGKKQWENYFGNIGEEPPLPENIHEILNKLCPFCPSKKVKETHMLVLIPKTVNGNPLNLKALGKLVKALKMANPAKYKFRRTFENDDQATDKSHWVMMTKDIIEESRNKSYTDQKALIAEFANKTRIDYEVPKALDAAICIFMHYIHFEEYLFNNMNFTSCQEKFNNRQISVGGFSDRGLVICPGSYFNIGVVGVAPLRRLS